jgi:8-oxo-dGTP pyrophosphatase MutT (NUDIX family)
MKLLFQKTVLSTKPFNVEEIKFEATDLRVDHSYFRIAAPDWVNVLPVLADGRVALIRQPRVGSMTYVLETPGGVMDPGERDPTMTAARELEEETGLTSQRILPLGSINPNPAIMTNVCHFFVALGCLPATKRAHFPDTDERIQVEIHEAASLDMLVRTGQINHALACLCVTLAGKYLKT